MIYPPKIAAIIADLTHANDAEGNAAGSDANFACGCFVRFKLSINRARMVVENVTFYSNGCGYMLAAAEILAADISGRKLADLHGLDSTSLAGSINSMIGEPEPGRTDCITVVANALRNAFADFRSRQIEEFRGEKALVCSCFGVTEELIEDAIRDCGLLTVADVSTNCNAGSGCGSCRMLIQEILDAGARS